MSIEDRQLKRAAILVQVNLAKLLFSHHKAFDLSIPIDSRMGSNKCFIGNEYLAFISDREVPLKAVQHALEGVRNRVTSVYSTVFAVELDGGRIVDYLGEEPTFVAREVARMFSEDMRLGHRQPDATDFQHNTIVPVEDNKPKTAPVLQPGVTNEQVVFCGDNLNLLTRVAAFMNERRVNTMLGAFESFPKAMQAIGRTSLSMFMEELFYPGGKSLVVYDLSTGNWKEL